MELETCVIIIFVIVMLLIYAAAIRAVNYKAIIPLGRWRKLRQERKVRRERRERLRWKFWVLGKMVDRKWINMRQYHKAFDRIVADERRRMEAER